MPLPWQRRKKDSTSYTAPGIYFRQCIVTTVFVLLYVILYAAQDMIGTL